MKYKHIILLFILAILMQPVFAQNAKKLDSITTTLEKVFDLDQGIRHTRSVILEKYGQVSPEFTQANQEMIKQDKADQQIVFSIFDKYGWLTKKQTSEKAGEALFYVLQHADLEDQLKYSTLVTGAFKAGETSALQYAIFNDRINSKQGKFQVYGSQSGSFGHEDNYIYPIFDEPNVDKRRKKIGLAPLGQSAKQMDNDNYKVPKKDTLKGKVVLIGHIYNPAQNGIAGVEVRLNDQLIGRTNENGFFYIPVKKGKDEKLIVSIIKEGYKPLSHTFTGDKDFFEMYFQLGKTQ